MHSPDQRRHVRSAESVACSSGADGLQVRPGGQGGLAGERTEDRDTALGGR